MTSKISFFKLLKEDIKHRSISILVSCFFCLAILLFYVMKVQSILADYTSSTDILNQMQDASYIPSYGVLATVMLGFLCAFEGFRFLHFRSQMDLYQALPLKRGKRFALVCVSSFLIFIIPFTMLTGLEVLVSMLLKVGTSSVITNLLLTYFMGCLSFLLSFVFMALAMIMTGQQVVGLLGYGVFASYFPIVLRYLLPTYCGTFFNTYNPTTDENYRILDYFSPITLSGLLTNYLSTTLMNIFASILMILFIGVLSYILYKKRPSEAAGRAMAFSKFNLVLKFLLVIPVALYAGIFLQNISSGTKLIWMIVGIIFGSIVCHGLIESIYQFDIHGFKSHKRHLAAIMVLCAGFAMVFCLDLIHYDTYVPKESALKSISILPNNVSIDGKNSDAGIAGEDMKKVLPLVKTMAENSLNQDDADGYATNFKIAYHLKNGSTKYRVYTINHNDYADGMNTLYSIPTYKKNLYPFLNLRASQIKSLEFTQGVYEETMNLNQKDMDEFLRIYKSELLKINYTDSITTCPISTISLDKYDNVDPDVYYDTTYPIYPSFTKTIQWLKNKGYDASSIFTSDDYKLEQITVSNSDGEADGRETYTITDKKVLKQLSNYLYVDTFCDKYGFDNYSRIINITAKVKRKGYTSVLVDAYIDERAVNKLKK